MKLYLRIFGLKARGSAACSRDVLLKSKIGAKSVEYLLRVCLSGLFVVYGFIILLQYHSHRGDSLMLGGLGGLPPSKVGGAKPNSKLSSSDLSKFIYDQFWGYFGNQESGF